MLCWAADLRGTVQRNRTSEDIHKNNNNAWNSVSQCTNIQYTTNRTDVFEDKPLWEREQSLQMPHLALRPTPSVIYIQYIVSYCIIRPQRRKWKGRNSGQGMRGGHGQVMRGDPGRSQGSERKRFGVHFRRTTKLSVSKPLKVTRLTDKGRGVQEGWVCVSCPQRWIRQITFHYSITH